MGRIHIFLVLILLLLPLGCSAPASFAPAETREGLYRPPAAASTLPAAPAASSQPVRQQLDEAISLSAQLKYDQACRILEPLARPAPPYAAAPAADRFMPEILFWLGYCRQKSGQSAMAASTYQQLIRQYRLSHFSQLAQQRLAELPAPQSP